MIYEIRVEGYLDGPWAEWFSGLSVSHDEAGDTFLTGTLVDQAALYGVLKRVRDLGLPLVSVNRLDPEPGAPRPQA